MAKAYAFDVVLELRCRRWAAQNMEQTWAGNDEEEDAAYQDGRGE